MIRCGTIKNSTCSKVVAMVCRDTYLSLTMLTLLHVYNRNIRHETGCKIYQVMFLWYLGAPKHMIRILFILFNCSKTNFTVFFENKYCWKRKDNSLIKAWKWLLILKPPLEWKRVNIIEFQLLALPTTLCANELGLSNELDYICNETNLYPHKPLKFWLSKYKNVKWFQILNVDLSV